MPYAVRFTPGGAGPLTGVITGPGGVIFGSTVFGGRHGNGTVFALTLKGSGYTERAASSAAARSTGSPPERLASAQPSR